MKYGIQNKETNVCLFQEVLKTNIMLTQMKKVIDNKQFWKTIKPLDSDKSVSRDRINIIEKEEIDKSKSEAAEILNKFFSDIVKNLGIPVYNDFDPIIENMKAPVILKLF